MLRSSLWVLVPLFLGATTTAVAQRTHKTVFVIADGIPADVIERLQPPHMEAIAKAGGFRRAYVGGLKGGYSQTPTVSAPGYNDLLTGTWANKHNVWDNDIPAPNYNYHTIFRLYKEAHPDGKTAVFSTWLDNRTKLIGDGLAATGGHKVDYAFDGYEVDTVRFPHKKHPNLTHEIDELVVQEADSVIRAAAPDLSWVYLEYTDDVGHSKGTGAAFDTAVGMLDVQMGHLWDAIQYRESHFKEDWQIVITTDHGRDPKSGRGHGYQSDRERTTWIITNVKGNNYFDQCQPGIVDILPSIARFLNVPIAQANGEELDGVSFVGAVSIAQPKVTLEGDSLVVAWKAMEQKGNVTVRVTATNNFKTGGTDNYTTVATVPVGQEVLKVALGSLPVSDMYKFVIEGKDNTVNQWWVKGKK